MKIGCSESFFEKVRSKPEKQSAFMAGWAADWDFENESLMKGWVGGIPNAKDAEACTDV